MNTQAAMLAALFEKSLNLGPEWKVVDEMCIRDRHERYRNDPEPFVGYYVAFFASAYLGVITRWIETGMRESSEEMALIAMRLFFIKPGESIKL